MPIDKFDSSGDTTIQQTTTSVSMSIGVTAHFSEEMEVTLKLAISI
jgi:hypothetical protein